MSSNKRRYYRVVTTQVISADSKRDALAKAQRKPHIDADVLATFVDGERLKAMEAREEAEELLANA